MKTGSAQLRAVLFDMDGTIVDVSYDWAEIKRELQTNGRPILHHISSLEEPDRTRKWRRLEEFEEKATAQAELMDGVPELLGFLSRRNIKTALVTNNSRTNTDRLLRRFDLEFDLVLTRERGLWKPSADPFLEVMRLFELSASECCALGDSRFDLLAAEAAGISCVFLVTAAPEEFRSSGAVLCRTISEVHSHLIEKLQSA